MTALAPPTSASNQAWASDPIGYLIGPNDADAFFAETYEREALIVRRTEPERYASLLSIAELDELICTSELTVDNLQLTQADQRLTPADYSFDNGIVDRGAAARRHQLGATIILNQLHARLGKLGAFCRALEHELSAHVQTNIYLTPPHAQGFRTHYDNHDVFVVQVSGEKTWRLYQKPVEAPYRGEGFQPGAVETGALAEEFVLKAGDCAYVPRGLMHDAATSGAEPSLHITAGVIPRTWADLMLEAVSEIALKDVRFRRSLPVGFARPDYDRAQANAHFSELVDAVAEGATLDGALEVFIDSFIRSRAIDNRGAVSGASRPIAAEDRFLRRALAPFRIAMDDDRPVVIAPGGEVNFNAGEEAAVRRALNGDAFSLADFVDLDDTPAREVVGKLLGFGLIERV